MRSKSVWAPKVWGGKTVLYCHTHTVASSHPEGLPLLQEQWAITANPSPLLIRYIWASFCFYCWCGKARTAEKAKLGWDGGRSAESQKVLALLNKVSARLRINPVSETGFNYQPVDRQFPDCHSSARQPLRLLLPTVKHLYLTASILMARESQSINGVKCRNNNTFVLLNDSGKVPR